MYKPILRGAIVSMLIIASIAGMEPIKTVTPLAQEKFIKKLTSYLTRRKKDLLAMLDTLENERRRLQPYLDFATDQIDIPADGAFQIHELRARGKQGTFCKRGLVINILFLEKYHALLGRNDDDSHRSLQITRDFFTQFQDMLTLQQRDHLSYIDRNFVTIFNTDTKDELKQGTIVSDRGKIERAFSNCIAFIIDGTPQSTPLTEPRRSGFRKPRPDSPAKFRSFRLNRDGTLPTILMRPRSHLNSSESSCERNH